MLLFIPELVLFVFTQALDAVSFSKGGHCIPH